MMDSWSDQFEEQSRQSGAAPVAFRPEPSPVQVTPIFVVPSDPLIELQRRLDVAAAFQALVSESPFDEDTPATRTVWSKVRNFVSQELQSLVGMGPTAKPAVVVPGEFSSEEIIALKVLARSLIARQQVPAPAAAPAQPPASAQAAPLADPPPPAKLTAPKRPKTKKVKAPPSFASSSEPAPTASTSPPAPAQAVEGTPAQTTPQVGSVFSDNEYTIKVVNEKGEIIEKKVRPNITKQVRPAGGLKSLPMPGKLEFETQVNARAEAEADLNARSFVRRVGEAPKAPITR